MHKAFKFRMYPNKDQEKQLAQTFGSSRFIYNHFLAKQKERLDYDQKHLGKNKCNNFCNQELKIELPWLTEVDKFALTNSIYDLEDGFQRFFSHQNGFPKFKSKHNHYYSYTTNFTNDNIKVDFANNQVQLPKLGKVKAKLHREFHNAIIKQATISRVPSGKYYVSILVDMAIAKLPELETKIGFDLGLKTFLVDDTGNEISRPRALYKYEKKLAKAQRKLAKKKPGSNNRKKQKNKIAIIHEKITNVRNDFSHKLSTRIINENQVIISEDLKISNMIKNHKLAKSIADVSWGNFLEQIAYKAKWYGRVYHKVSPWYASTKTCHDCGKKAEKVILLSERSWVCEKCGVIHDRDHNAAKNILKEGLKNLGL